MRFGDVDGRFFKHNGERFIISSKGRRGCIPYSGIDKEGGIELEILESDGVCKWMLRKGRRGM